MTKLRIYSKTIFHEFKCIQTNPVELCNRVCLYAKEYSEISAEKVNRNPLNIIDAKTSKESYYYWIRRKYNTPGDVVLDTSAMFIFFCN